MASSSKAAALEGLVWHSLAYDPYDSVAEFAGPDQNTRCEAPRHRFGDYKPMAAWVELLWYPKTTKTVARSWKTCEECHVAMATAAERTDPMPMISEEAAMEQARGLWPEAEGFERVPGGWTFRVGGGYASVTDAGRVATDPQGTRGHAKRFM